MKPEFPISRINGIQVVLTDNKGAYQLPAGEENIFFVIKPSGYRTPLNGNNTPKFYYHHNPKGAPAQFKYKGIGPTGNLPEAINFPLVKSEDKKISILLCLEIRSHIPKSRSNILKRNCTGG